MTRSPLFPSRRLLPLGVSLGLALTAAAGPAAADILAPVEPPSAQQVQAPAADRPAPGPALPLALAVKPGADGDAGQPEVPADMAAFVKALLHDTVAAGTAVVLVDAAPADAAPAGAAKNIAAGPVAPAATVTASIGKRLVKPVLGDAYAPVDLGIVRDGKTIATESFKVVPASRDTVRPDIAAFLAKHLPLAAATAAATPAAAGPGLKLWMETEGGGPVRVGSKVVVYWQPTRDGYVSVYHFGSSGAVERVFPVASMPENFVQAGRIYRFPAQGHLTFKGPAGPETFRAVITTYPSNTPRSQPDGLQFKGEPLRIIPTHYPMLFANEDLSRVYALPPSQFGETHLAYTLQGK